MKRASPAATKSKVRSNSLVVASKETVRNMQSKFQTIEEESSSSEDFSQQDGVTEDDEMFDGLLDKINSRVGDDGSMSSQFARFQASTAFISKIADGKELVT